MKLKKSVKIILLAIIIIIVAIFIGIKSYQNHVYRNSVEYKLLERGYSEEDIEVFKEGLDEKVMEELITTKRDPNLVKLLSQKYYLKKNYDRYIAYINVRPETDLEDVVAIVNVKADYKWYDEEIIKDVDMSKENTILVNKFNKLPENYEPQDLVDISIQYAYDNNRIRSHVNAAYIEMAKDAKKEGLSLIASSSYRSYQNQEIIYNRSVANSSVEITDKTSARPGHSEHQTGLTIDILTYNVPLSAFENTEEYHWLQENAHKYGFIMRYPSDKEYLTGYSYESWHYRYLGIDLATKVYNEGITYDEYYAYYLDN